LRSPIQSAPARDGVALVLLLLTAALPSGPARGADPILQWPLDLPHRHLTSNFMEYRPGRLHAGLDLRTEGRTGFPVRAAESGHVFRIRTSAQGYGQVVYLRGASGRTYVYAHLERLADPLRAALRGEQRRRGRYAVEIRPPTEEFPVERGAVLGLSGQSGTAGPHLHFEVRDAAQRPLNPLEFFALDDAIAPIVTHLRAVPAPVAGARIAGRVDPHVIVDPRGLSGQLPALEIAGPVAFAARIVDHADPRRYRLEPYHLELRLDDRLVLEIRNDSFAFAEQSRMRLEWLETGGLRERWLHLRPENSLPGRRGEFWYAGPRGQGLEPGAHRLELKVTDRAGNAAELAWTVDVLPPVAEGDPVGGGWENGRVFPPDLAGLFTGEDGRGERDGDSGSTRWRPAIVGARVALAGPRDLIVAPLGRCYLTGEAPTEAIVLDGILQPVSADLIAPWLAAGDLLTPVNLLATIVTDSLRPDAAVLRASQGLIPAGPVAGCIAWEWPARRAPWLELAASPTTPTALIASAAGEETEVNAGLGVYRRDAQGDWAFVAPPRRFARRDGTGVGDEVSWFFPLVEPGVHALMLDVAPPRLSAWEGAQTVGPGPRVTAAVEVTPPRWEVLAVGMVDDGSGIDVESLQVWLDGSVLIAEPDLPRDRILVELPDDLAPGHHILGVEVADRAGNFTARSLPVDCRP